jgi:tetratricopeptide (TPR) repeat protein
VSSDDFLAQASRHLLKLRRQRLILDEDLGILLKQATGLSKDVHDIHPLEEIVLERGLREAETYARQLMDSDYREWFGSNTRRLSANLNTRGYGLMAVNRLDEACDVFTLNTLLFPKDWNVWDSLAEYYYTKGELYLALEYYETSVEMNPPNDNGKQMIQRIRRETGK